MRTIWKAVLPIHNHVPLVLPVGSIPLSVQAQSEQLCLWFICDSEWPLEDRVVKIYGSGHDARDLDIFRDQYLGTVQMLSGTFVVHVFLAPAP